MRFAVTGATGFIGGRLARRLLFDGHEVVAVVRYPHRARALSELGVDVIEGDVTSRSSLIRAFRGVDGVFHVAGWYRIGSRDTDQAWAVNVQGTRNALDAARATGAPRVVYTSTLAINSDTRGEVRTEDDVFSGRHISVYDRTKAQGHQIAQVYAQQGLDVVTAMPGAVYGPGDTSQLGELIRRTAHGERVLAPAGLHLCMAHVEDIAAGHVLAMQRGDSGQSYMLAGPQASAVEVLRTVADLTGGPYPRVVPTPLVKAGARALAALPSAYGAESLRVAGATYLGSAAKAQRELGWTARGVRDGLAQTLREELSRPAQWSV